MYNRGREREGTPQRPFPQDRKRDRLPVTSLAELLQMKQESFEGEGPHLPEGAIQPASSKCVCIVCYIVCYIVVKCVTWCVT